MTLNRYRNAHITSSGLIPAISDFSGPGEVILNIPDGKSFTLDYGNNVIQIGGNGGGILLPSGSTVSSSYSVTSSFARKAQRSEVEFHVADYFDSSVSTDWGLAINAAIADCLGSSDPVTTVRTATGPIILPPGNLQVRTQIAIKSAIGVAMRGSDRYATALCPDSVASGLDLVGVVYSSFQNFSIRGAGQVTDGIHSYHDATQAIKYPTTLTFINVDVMELDFVSGFHIGGATNGDQTDKHSFFDCKVSGRWTWGNGFTRSRDGYLFGIPGGGAGNNLCHNIYNLNVANVAYAVQNGGCNVNVYGGSTEQNHIVINDSGGPIEPCVFSGIRSEGARYLYVSLPGASWDRKAILEGCAFHGGNMEGSSWMQLGGGGTYIINNCQMIGNDPGNYTPTISLGSSGALTTVIVNGLSICNGDISSLEGWIQYEANTTVIAQGVCQTNGGGGMVSMSSYMSRVQDAATITGSRGTSTALGGLLNSFKLRGTIKDTSYSTTPISDNFVRANTTASLGPGWLTINNGGGISTNQGYFPINTGSRPIALLGGMTNGIIEADIVSSDWNVVPGAIVFRYSDPNNFMMVSSTGANTAGLFAMVTGSLFSYQTKVFTGFNNSTYQLMKIVVTDNILDVVMANVPLVRWTMTPTQVAMAGTGSGVTFGNGTRPLLSLINSYTITPQ